MMEMDYMHFSTGFTNDTTARPMPRYDLSGINLFVSSGIVGATDFEVPPPPKYVVSNMKQIAALTNRIIITAEETTNDVIRQIERECDTDDGHSLVTASFTTVEEYLDLIQHPVPVIVDMGSAPKSVEIAMEFKNHQMVKEIIFYTGEEKA